MSTIVPLYRSVKDLLNNQIFGIDEYQREYKWGRENILELINDLRAKFFSSYQEGHDTGKVASYEDYFLGSIIVSRRDNKKFLVDGQQRITSLTLLLIYLYHAAKAKYLPVVSQMATLIYSDNLGTPAFNLDIAERLPVIKALFDQAAYNPSSTDESIQNMHARYRDIEDEGLVEDLDEALPHFIYWLITKVGLIEILTDNDNYAYAIFETMNDRGKPLSPVDMLKAYLLAPVSDEAQRRNANLTWKREVLALISYGGDKDDERDANCMKAWLRAQYALSTRDRKAGASDKDWEIIGSAFHRWARDNATQLGLGKAEKHLDIINTELPFFSKAYQRILYASKNYTPRLEAIFYNAHNEFTFQNTVLLAALNPADSWEITERKLAITARYLDIWVMRRVTNYIRVGYSSVSYAMFQLCKEIRRKPLDELVTILTDRLANDDTTFDGCPSKDRHGLVALELNQFSRRFIYHLLARVTSYLEVKSGLPDLFSQYVDRERINPCDIEHIVPDNFADFSTHFNSPTEFQNWRNNVAGLLLLPADVNRSYQDKPFKDKAPHYAAQNLFAASLTAAGYQHKPKFLAFVAEAQLPLQAYEEFGLAQQAERKKVLKALVNAIWSPALIQQDAQE
ncbi:MAG: DUF262 domain-containing protein [Betaproteobacteria bacterium]